MENSTVYAAGGALLAVLAGFLLLRPTGLVKWLQRKNYQYEVTFALYMLTPTEKFVFNSILFLAMAMFLIASILYLPDHLATISRRTYYYFIGDAELYYGSATRAVRDATVGWAQSAYQAALSRTAA